jgi:DNA polymerase V
VSTLLPQLLDAPPIRVHELDSLIKAGFPSPAEDLGATRIDVFDKLIVRPAATFVMRVSGDSLIAYKIFDGDVIVIDRGVKARHGHIVVAHLDNDFLVKCLYKKNGVVKLLTGNPTFPDIVPKEGQTLNVWGVVTASVTRFVPV